MAGWKVGGRKSSICMCWVLYKCRSELIAFEHSARCSFGYLQIIYFRRLFGYQQIYINRIQVLGVLHSTCTCNSVLAFMSIDILVFMNEIVRSLDIRKSDYDFKPCQTERHDSGTNRPCNRPSNRLCRSIIFSHSEQINYLSRHRFSTITHIHASGVCRRCSATERGVKPVC